MFLLTTVASILFLIASLGPIVLTLVVAFAAIVFLLLLIFLLLLRLLFLLTLLYIRRPVFFVSDVVLGGS